MKEKVSLLWGVILILSLFSCRGKALKFSETGKAPLYHTWLSLNERQYGTPVSPLPEEIPPEGFLPWAGIASHHLLTHDYLDAWFSRLAEIRMPQCFYILSPSHYGLSLEPYSLTTGSWESGFGLVESDLEKVRKLAKLLDVDLDPYVFEAEHGVSTFMPYIKKYFPSARVVAVAYEGDGPVNIPVCGRLATVMENEFDDEGRQHNFLLVSADFSHRGNPEETEQKDFYSDLFLKNTAGISWNMVSCDNRPGMYIIDRLGKNNLESSILYRTNSWEISGEGKDDITSYFFVYFADKKFKK